MYFNITHVPSIRIEDCIAIAMHLTLFNLKKTYLLVSLQRYHVLNIPMAFLYSQQFIFLFVVCVLKI